jgi:hypothetical protein
MKEQTQQQFADIANQMPDFRDLDFGIAMKRFDANLLSLAIKYEVTHFVTQINNEKTKTKEKALLFNHSKLMRNDLKTFAYLNDFSVSENKFFAVIKLMT